MKLEQTVLIERPVPRVFAFRSALDNAPTWRHDVRATTLATPGPTQMGTRCTELRQRPNGTTEEWQLEVTEFEVDHVLRLATSCGDLAIDERHCFSVDQGCTRYTLHVEVIAGQIVPVGLQKRMVEAMLSLKWLLEGRGLGYF